MVPDLIAPLLLCVALGCALSLFVAALLPQFGHGFTLSDIAARLVLAVGPLYLAANYVISQGAWLAAASAAGLAFGLYCLRGWWVPEHLSGAPDVAAKTLRSARLSGRKRTADSLRRRLLSVVGDDRRLEERAAGGDQRRERPAREGSLANAA